MTWIRHIGSIRRAFSLRHVLVCAFSLWAGLAFGQVPDEPDEIEPPAEEGVIIEGMEGQGQQPDSAKPQKVVRIRTLWVSPAQLIDNQNPRTAVGFSLGQVLEPDLLWRQDGFYHWLGQIGKPYRRSVYGVESSFFRPQGIFINPYTDAEDVHILDSESGMPFYDTRTPFVNVYYGQGKVDLAQVRVDISQNISPFINVGLLYYRRNSSGVYGDFETSHNNAGLSLNARTPNERYHAFLSGTFHQGDDGLNGGVAQIDTFENLFGKSSQPVALADARLQRYVRAVHFQHTLRITGDSVVTSDTLWSADSVPSVETTSRPHRLRLYNSLLAENFENQYSDFLIEETVNDVQFPVYQTLGDTNYFYERYRQTRLKADAGISYRFRVKRFETGHRAEIATEQIVFEKNYYDRTLNRLTNSYFGDLRLSTLPFELRADARFQNSVTNRFGPETFAELGGSLGLPKSVFNYAYKEPGPIKTELDSVLVNREHRPLSIVLRSIVYSRNPTLQQAYGAGWPGNTITTDSTLSNTRFEHIRLGLVYRGKARWTKAGEVPGTEIGVAGFVSRLNGYTYYDTAMVLRQAPSASHLQYLGAEAKLRIRMGKFYLENRTVYQIVSSDAGLDTLVGRMQPNLYGKASFYFESKQLKFASILRIGLDYYYHLNYYAPLFDGPSQQFYPQNIYLNQGYHRLDAFAGTQVKRAYIFLKVAHANEGLFTPGYFTTLLYPMLDRTVMLGVNWTFFD